MQSQSDHTDRVIATLSDDTVRVAHPFVPEVIVVGRFVLKTSDEGIWCILQRR